MAPSDEFADTDPRALEVWLDLERRMPPGRKLPLVLEMSWMILQLAEAGVRKLYPGAGEREVLCRTAARFFDRQTMIRAYGWDPESDDESRNRV